MVAVSQLEGRLGKADVEFRRILCVNFSSVDDILCLTVTFKGTVVFVTTVACSGDWVILFIVQIHHSGIVGLDDRIDIWHATVAHLHRIAVEDFTQFRVLWEMSVDQLEKSTTNASRDTFAVRGVEPYYISVSVPPSLPYWLLYVTQSFIVSAAFKRIIINWRCLAETFFITGDAGNASAD